MLTAYTNLLNRWTGTRPKRRLRQKEAIALVVSTFLMAIAVAGCAESPATRSPAASTIAPTAGPVVSTPTATPAKLATASAVPIGSRLPGSPVKGYQVSGYVMSGGDTTPADLLDAPRKYSYTVQTDDGLSETVTYTAYPPSPNPDLGKKIRLSFHAGGILIGDYVQARGSYDQDTKTLLVAEEGDYIETFAHKP